jgi:hypothetical protein
VTASPLNKETAAAVRACVALLTAMRNEIPCHIDEILDGVEGKDAFFAMGTLLNVWLVDLPPGGAETWLRSMAVYVETGELPPC